MVNKLLLGGSSSWSTKNDSFGMGQQNPLGQGNNSYWNRELENSEQSKILYLLKIYFLFRLGQF